MRIVYSGLFMLLLLVWAHMQSNVFAQQTQYPSPYNYQVIPSFNPAIHLPNETMRSAHQDWWEGYQSPEKYFQDGPDNWFAAGDLSNSDRNGTYSYARAGGQFLSSLADAIRTTGDPAILDELYHWSGTLRTNLRDHDGRGYPYFRYMKGDSGCRYGNCVSKFGYTDTNFLDEQMLAGVIAQIAEVFHQNRTIDNKYAREADFWFTYLDENWVPKWLSRTTYGVSGYEYTPPEELSLHNAVRWDAPDNAEHDDLHQWAGPHQSKWSGGAYKHMFPVREFAHPYLMSIYQYKVMGDYFIDQGVDPKGTPNRNANDYLQEAQTRHDWWYEKTTPRSDGSRDWWITLSNSTGGTRSDSYSQQVNVYLNALHWRQFGRFAQDAAMNEYAKVWYEEQGQTSVYKKNNTQTMTYFSSGSGGTDAFVMRFSSLMGCWDESGEILRLNEAVIHTPQSHSIGIGDPDTASSPPRISTTWHHGSHYNGILSCELKEAYDTGLLSEDTETACTIVGDIDCSGEVNLVDVSLLLSKYGSDDSKADIDGSGEVNVLDLAPLLLQFGSVQ